MEELLELFEQFEIPEERLRAVAAQALENPMAAMASLQEYMTPEMTQQLLGYLMTNPAALEQVARHVGLSDEDVGRIQDKLNPSA
jgi:hypothetical protein